MHNGTSSRTGFSKQNVTGIKNPHSLRRVHGNWKQTTKFSLYGKTAISNLVVTMIGVKAKIFVAW